MNLDNGLYNMIFKRKSFHLFRNIGNVDITDTEIDHIQEKYKSFIPLCPDIKTAIRMCLQHNGMEYTVDLYIDRGTDTERTKVATYYFHGNGKLGSKGVDGHKREYYSKFNDER